MPTEDPPLRVLIVDDNKTVRRGIRMRLEHSPGITVVGEAATGRDAVLIAQAEKIDVVLMDLHMPGVNGIDATRAITSAPGRSPKVVLVTSELSDAFVLDAFDAGASGYLLKNHDGDQLIHVIRGAASGTATISSHMTPTLLRELARLRPAGREDGQAQLLSPAERRVVGVLSSGLTSSEDIARKLSVSVNTVRSQTASALRKLHLDDRTQLALWGVRHGFVDHST
jgi:DNA-binding NarL/FixJ family response regulator